MHVKLTPEQTAEVRDELSRLRQGLRVIESRLGVIPTPEELKASIKSTIDEMHEGIQIIGYDYSYIYLNLAAAMHGKKSVAELVGKKMSDAYPGIEQTEMYQILQRTMNERIPRRMENEFNYGDGDRGWFELFFEPHPRGVLLRSIDISERKRIEEQFLHSQKLEAVGQLAGGIAHDFNNKLGIMMLYCDLVQDQCKAGDPVFEHVQKISMAVSQSASLTRQLLAFSRKQVLDLQVVNLNDLLYEEQSTLEKLIGENIQLHFHLAADLGNVRVDPTQVDQVLLNLCVNARDAISDNGVMTIETANVELDRAYADTHPEVNPGEYILLSVSDTGEGIDDSTLARIFEPFFTTKEKGKGTGLGLATVHGIVKQSNGHIWVYSELGIGTTFKIYLPRVNELAQPEHKGSIVINEISGTETILLVEDDSLLREAFVQALRGAGYNVLPACSAAEAQRLFENRNRQIQMVLTDVVLPDLSGRDLVIKLQEKAPDLRAIYMSGYTENSIVHHGVLDTESVLLQKPVSVKKLLQVVRSVMDGVVKKGVL